MTQHVLYLSYDGMTDPLGQSQVLPYLRGLTAHGYRIHLVSFEKPDRFLKHSDYIREYCEKAGIHWHPQDYVLGGSIFTTLRQVRRMRKIAFYLSHKYRFDIVHCRSYIAALAGLQLKRKKGIRFIFDMRGFWADERVDGGLWNLKSPLYRTIYRFFKRKEIQFIKEADWTISLTEAGKQEIESWKKLQGCPLKIRVIPCCVDLELFDPSAFTGESRRELRARFGIPSDTYLLGYVGSIGTWYMLPEMLNYFSELLKEKANARFLFITGENPAAILSEAEKQGIDTERILCTSVLHKDVPAHLSMLDASIFFIRPSYSKKASSPTKQGEIMAMGIPLICNSGVGDTDRIVEKYHAGSVVKQFSSNEFQRVIHSTETFNPTAISEGARDYFALSEGVARYLDVYCAKDE